MSSLSAHHLPWDSTFFGYKVCQLEGTVSNNGELASQLNELKTDKVQLVYWAVEPDDLNSQQAAANQTAFLADKKTTYLRTVPLDQSFNNQPSIRSYLHQPASKSLYNLALQSSAYSRYALDPHLKSEAARLYRTWLDNSLKGEIAREVLVYEKEGVPAGLLTLGEKNHRADIGLLAVDEQYRGQGIGQQLMQTAFDTTLQWGYNQIQVVTQQANTGACAFYEKQGFEIEKIQYIYHFWLS
ncbi:MAG TPA: GNAT family N-acetyltransferase [Vitreimonas sp.]|nr:GNAT family N-acetyltransferase [Vitreimonas sp.]